LPVRSRSAGIAERRVSKASPRANACAVFRRPAFSGTMLDQPV
jgi:hypothetical protein